MKKPETKRQAILGALLLEWQTTRRAVQNARDLGSHGDDAETAAREKVQTESNAAIDYDVVQDLGAARRRQQRQARVVDASRSSIPTADRDWLLAAASERSASSPRAEALLIDRRTISIEGRRCTFAYKKKPFAVFLMGDVPAGVHAFATSDCKWPVKWSLGDNAWHVPGIRLWQIDDLKDDVSWVK